MKSWLQSMSIAKRCSVWGSTWDHTGQAAEGGASTYLPVVYRLSGQDKLRRPAPLLVCAHTGPHHPGVDQRGDSDSSRSFVETALGTPQLALSPSRSFQKSIDLFPSGCTHSTSGRVLVWLGTETGLISLVLSANTDDHPVLPRVSPLDTFVSARDATSQVGKREAAH